MFNGKKKINSVDENNNLKNYNREEEVQIERIIRALIPATKAGKIKWKYKVSPYPQFTAFLGYGDWQIRITNNTNSFNVEVIDAKINSIFLKKYYVSSSYMIQEDSDLIPHKLWLAILQQPCEMKKQVDNIIETIEDVVKNNDDTKHV